MKLILILNMIRLVNPNNDSTPGIPITIQTPVKDSETPSTKSIPDFTIGLITPTKKNIGNVEANSLEKQIDYVKKLKRKVLKETFCKIFVITLRKYLTANLPPSNLNVRKRQKHREISTTNIDHLQNEF